MRAHARAVIVGGGVVGCAILYHLAQAGRGDVVLVDPWLVTQAYIAAAKALGAEVERFTKVTALEPRADGSWTVVTDKGSIHAEHVVNAGGLWAREVGRMAGLSLPVLAMEHH